jgi:hypothetical protein
MFLLETFFLIVYILKFSDFPFSSTIIKAMATPNNDPIVTIDNNDITDQEIVSNFI